MALELEIIKDVKDEVRAELQEQEKQYRRKSARRYLAWDEVEYCRGCADGIREALRAYGERGL